MLRMTRTITPYSIARFLIYAIRTVVWIMSRSQGLECKAVTDEIRGKTISCYRRRSIIMNVINTRLFRDDETLYKMKVILFTQRDL
jgi:hypothetical protein